MIRNEKDSILIREFYKLGLQRVRADHFVFLLSAARAGVLVYTSYARVSIGCPPMSIHSHMLTATLQSMLQRWQSWLVLASLVKSQRLTIWCCRCGAGTVQRRRRRLRGSQAAGAAKRGATAQAAHPLCTHSAVAAPALVDSRSALCASHISSAKSSCACPAQRCTLSCGGQCGSCGGCSGNSNILELICRHHLRTDVHKPFA